MKDQPVISKHANELTPGLDIEYIEEQGHAPPTPALAGWLAPSSIGFGLIRAAAELALRLGDSAAAQQAAAALARVFPDAIVPLALLGQALLESGVPRAAVEQFRDALKLNPLDAMAWAGLAGALAGCGQHAEARASLMRAALHDPLGCESLAPGIAHAPSSIGLGVVYLRRGHAALAVPELAAAIARHPWRDDLRMYYVEALRRAGDLAAARRELDDWTVEGAPNLPLLLLQAALAGDLADGAVAREHCARYDPDGQLARRFFAPDHPPWVLALAPAMAWSADFEPLAAYLAHLRPTAKSAPSADPFGATQGGQRSTSDLAPPLRAGDHQPAAVPPSETHFALHTSQPEPYIQHRAPGGAPQAANYIDPDVRAVVDTTDRLRSRFAEAVRGPGPLVPREHAHEHAQVLLANKSTLLRRYGAAGSAAIDQRLNTLAEVLGRRGIQVYCCYSDDASSLQLGDQIALAPVAHEPAAIRELVRAIGDGLAQQRRQLGTLLLIGGDDSIPFHRLPNPLADSDQAVLSDNPYGTDDAGYLLPQRTIARLPDGAEPDPALLLTLLDQMIEYHRCGEHSAAGRRAPTLLGLRLGAHPRALVGDGYSADVWRETSRAVLDALNPDAPLGACPPLDADSFVVESASAGGLLYLNLHGAAGLPNWYGQPDEVRRGLGEQLPIALRPDFFERNMVPGGLLISEACYGLDLAGRTVRTSIPLGALAAGALACVGATVNAYGSTSTPLLGADLLCQRLLGQLQRGVPIGAALHEARLELAQAMYRRQGYLDDVDIKTLTEFVLLGDPWARIAAPAAARSAWSVSRLTSIERLPKPRPKSMLSEDQVASDIVQRARAALKRVLPGATAARLQITAQPNPRRLQKGDTEQALIFSAQASQPTADGHQIAQTAHVTLNGRVVVKVALTR
jgi:tetratricopeptide (TPR) repeat protein